MSYKVSLLVPYRIDLGQRARNWHWCLQWWKDNLPPNYQICVGNNYADPYNRSAARNNAFSQSAGDILIVADADTVLESNAVLMEGVEKVASEEAAWVIPYKTYYNLSQEFTESLIKTTYSGSIKPSLHGFSYEHKILSWSGVLIVSRAAYQYVGGYDERFQGWGWEDLAFRVQLDAEWGTHQRVDGNAYHLWHSIDPNQTFKSPDEIRNHAIFKVNYETRYNWKDERIYG